MKKTALFPGSFNPLTLGHLSIIRRSAGIFDEVVVAVGVNIAKTSPDDIAATLDNIRRATAEIPNVRVITYQGLTVDACSRENATVIIRGLRNGTDFEYERQMAEINRRIGGIETVFINSLPEYDCISSSMVRELIHFGRDVSEFVP